MNYVVIVEHRGTRQIHKILLSAEQPVRVGRGWENDVIIDDEYIDGSHLSITMRENGLINVSDLDTKNGTRQAKIPIKGTRAYRIGHSLAIGESTLTIQRADADVAPATRQDVVHKASRLFSSFLWVSIAIVLLLVSVVGIDYWASAAETQPELLVRRFFEAFLGISVWCAIVGVIGKLFRHKTYFRLHWLFVCTLAATASIGVFFLDILRFNLDTDSANEILDAVFFVFLLGVAAYGTLSLCTRIQRGRKVTVACALACIPHVIAMSSSLLADEHEQWRANPSVNRINQPPSRLFKEPVTVAVHLQNTDALFNALISEVGAAGDTEPVLDETPAEEPQSIQITEKLDER